MIQSLECISNLFPCLYIFLFIPAVGETRMNLHEFFFGEFSLSDMLLSLIFWYVVKYAGKDG